MIIGGKLLIVDLDSLFPAQHQESVIRRQVALTLC